MITEKKEDLVDLAISQMIAIIKRFVEDSIKGNFYGKAIECLEVLRKGCISEDEPKAFNEFFENIKNLYSKGKHILFWKNVYIFFHY